VHGIQPSSVYHCEYCPLFFNLLKAKDKHVLKHHPPPPPMQEIQQHGLQQI
jgi:hypothetical protein